MPSGTTRATRLWTRVDVRGTLKQHRVTCTVDMYITAPFVNKGTAVGMAPQVATSIGSWENEGHQEMSRSPLADLWMQFVIVEYLHHPRRSRRRSTTRTRCGASCPWKALVLHLRCLCLEHISPQGCSPYKGKCRRELTPHLGPGATHEIRIMSIGEQHLSCHFRVSRNSSLRHEETSQ